MESRNYSCDYNFDWVEKMQPQTKVIESIFLNRIVFKTDRI